MDSIKRQLVNIPINDDDIVNTLEQMPRTPRDAGLVGVALKRKKGLQEFTQKSID